MDVDIQVSSYQRFRAQIRHMKYMKSLLKKLKQIELLEKVILVHVACSDSLHMLNCYLAGSREWAYT